MRTPHRIGRRSRATAALVATAAMVAVGLQAGTATATPGGDLDRGSLPAKVSPSEHASLLAKAEKGQAATAKALGLNSKVKLKVKDVVKNRDGATHVRYERTYAGLPVLGGDMVVHRAPDGAIEGTDKATNASLKVPTTKAPAKHKPSLAKAEGSTAPRKVIWAADGNPTLAWERVIGGVQADGATPNELHVITDAATGEKLYEYQAVHNGTGNSMYVGQV
ncbi:peptidase M4 family protein, partial [Streptomyces sp. TR02-1]